MDAPAGPQDSQLTALLKDLDPRAAPLVVTVFGDAIAPRGGNISLASLIRLMAPFGISERLVRTVVYRLSRDGWFATQTRGRRSFYELTPQAQQTFADADNRIYAASSPEWDGEWTLIQAPPDMPAKARQKLRDELKWRGFGQLSPTLMVSPGKHAHTKLRDIVSGTPMVFTASLTDLAGTADPKQVAATAWNIEQLNDAYSQFVDRFSQVSHPSGELDAFVLRSLVIHEYRRILLKDPQLPTQLLPSGWPGGRAKQLTASLYKSAANAADRHIEAMAECWSGPCPEPTASYTKRFELT